MKLKTLATIAGIGLIVAGIGPAVADSYVRLYGGSQNAVPPVPASATNPLFTQDGGVAQANITNLTAAIPNTSSSVNLVAASSHVVLKTDVGAAALHVDFANNTATTADFKIDPAGSITYSGPPISQFKVIGATATGNYSVLAY